MISEGHALTRILSDQLLEVGPPAVRASVRSNAQSNVDEDEVLLERVLAGDLVTPVQRVWTNAACLVATRRQAAHACFGHALSSVDLPVVVRRSGGTAVVHHNGTLQLSLALASDKVSVEHGYLQLTSMLVQALARLGLTASLGSVGGSCCDGAYNVVVGGRKLAGTAAFTKRSRGRCASVFHAVIAIAGDVEIDVERVNSFEARLGRSTRYDPRQHCTLETLMR